MRSPLWLDTKRHKTHDNGDILSVESSTKHGDDENVDKEGDCQGNAGFDEEVEVGEGNLKLQRYVITACTLIV